MIDSIIQWLNTIPIQGPVRAFAMIGIMLGFAAVLYGLWEGIITMVSRFRGEAR
jgi:hypothetical protein